MKNKSDPGLTIFHDEQGEPDLQT